MGKKCISHWLCKKRQFYVQMTDITLCQNIVAYVEMDITVDYGKFSGMAAGATKAVSFKKVWMEMSCLTFLFASLQIASKIKVSVLTSRTEQ